MTAFQQYNVLPAMTAVRLCSNVNVAGTYFNGFNNNGVGATLTVAASSLTVDSVVAAVGDRILLSNQTSAFQNGIYVVNSIGTTVVLQRSADLQSIEQCHAGFYVSVGAGSAINGSIFAIVEPIPAVLGVNSMVWADVNAATDIALPTILNHIAIYTNTAGALGEDASTAINGGNIQAGLSGTAGTLGSFPSAATSGELLLAAVTNSAGNFNTTISNASSVGQAQVVSIPDSGASTANFILSKSAADQHITVSGLAADAGALTSGISTGGFVGLVKAFPTTATSGFIALQGAVNASGNFGTTISNSLAQGQASVITIPDPGAATSQFVLSQSKIPTNQVAFTVVKTAGFAALGTAGKINLVSHPSATSQFAILDIKVFKSTGLSGGGGDRLLSVSDGTIVFNNAGITAALLGTPIFTLWGGTGNPVAVGAADVSTAGADIFLQYIGGTTDYTAGSVVVAVTMVQTAA